MKPRALFLSPESPVMGSGGGGMRSAALLDYLRSHYETTLLGLDLPPNSRSVPARALRNLGRLIRGVPPLFDRYSGHSLKIPSTGYELAVVEHFWCASYAPVLRPHARRLVLDLHNVESQLAHTHAQAARWPESWISTRFGEAYERLEHEWLKVFDVILVASALDATRISHPKVVVYPNALPIFEKPAVAEEPCIIFTGNLEYHPNIEAVRWFRNQVWPHLRNETTWRIAGRNAHAIRKLVADDPKIELLGEFDDALGTIARAQVAIVPLLSGSGTRFKILEAWAAGRAVVSTTVGAEGLEARAGEHLLIADTPSDFSHALRRLLADATLRAKLGEAGRAHYLKHFTWAVAARALNFA